MCIRDSADHMPVWGETLCVTKWHVAEDGGKGSNVSVALGRLGIDTAYIGKVGNDPWGDLGEKWMQDAGVDTTYLYLTTVCFQEPVAIMYTARLADSMVLKPRVTALGGTRS